MSVDWRVIGQVVMDGVVWMLAIVVAGWLGRFMGMAPLPEAAYLWAMFGFVFGCHTRLERAKWSTP